MTVRLNNRAEEQPGFKPSQIHSPKQTRDPNQPQPCIRTVAPQRFRAIPQNQAPSRLRTPPANSQTGLNSNSPRHGPSPASRFQPIKPMLKARYSAHRNQARHQSRDQQNQAERIDQKSSKRIEKKATHENRITSRYKHPHESMRGRDQADAPTTQPPACKSPWPDEKEQNIQYALHRSQSPAPPLAQITDQETRLSQQKTAIHAKTVETLITPWATLERQIRHFKSNPEAAEQGLNQ